MRPSSSWVMPSSWPTACPGSGRWSKTLTVPAWRARLIARETRDLSLDAARFADRLIAATPDKIGSVHAARLVQEARLYFDPDRAVADEDEALAKRGVWLRPGAAPATTEMWMTLDTPDAEHFDHTVARVASDLRELGDTDTLDVRRARAVGILADPQHALDLMSGREGAAPSPGSGGVANLFVHLTPEDLQRPEHRRHRCGHHRTPRRRHHPAAHRLAGPADRHRREGHPPPGPRPQHPDGRWTSTTHPHRCANRCVLRDAHCVFPGCRRDSRACDLDHINPYVPIDDGGPPGPDPPRQPRPAVPDPSPGQDPHRLGLPTPRPR